MNDPIRIAVVDRHPLFRDGVSQTIMQQGLQVVAAGETAIDACRIAVDTQPDILLLDINVSGNGLDAARRILREHPNTKVVILTALDDDEHVDQALRAGVQGYILKGVSGVELLCAIEIIHRGDPYITPTLATRILVQKQAEHKVQDKIAAVNLALTPREREVLHCLTKGLSNNEIASELGVTVRYTKYLLAITYKKMHVRNRVGAILEAQKMGLVPARKAPN